MRTINLLSKQNKKYALHSRKSAKGVEKKQSAK